MRNFDFRVKKQSKDTKPRVGNIKTLHGEIETPAFMPCATIGSVKTLTPEELNKISVQIVLGNAYHLYLRPGIKTIKKSGGLHKFMGWEGPILADSGGFQVFSLAKLRKITEKGVEFQSHLDGSKLFFTPEKVIEIQKDLGSDIMLPLDVCSPANTPYKQAKEAMELTHRWAEKSTRAYQTSDVRYQAALFGIVQGVTYDDLRVESAKFIAERDFFGIAVGGLSVGEERKTMYHILDIIYPHLPKEKPRHLLGVGEPKDILEAVERGMDMFDSVLPTRLGRHGSVWTKRGRVNLNNEKYKLDQNPIEKDCQCYTCQHFTQSYIRHLVHEKEILGMRLATIHNLYFIVNLMKNTREAIFEGRFTEFKKEFLGKFKN